MNIVLSGRPPRYVNVVADSNLPAGRRAIRHAWLDFGRNYRVSLAIARFLLIAEMLAVAAMTPPARSVYITQGLMLAWAACAAIELALPHLAWRKAIRFQPAFSALDWGILGALIVVHPTISPAFLILVPLMATANQMPHSAKAVIIVALLCVAATVGVSIGPFNTATVGPQWLYICVVCLAAAVALANWYAHQAYRAQFRKWSDHLGIAAFSAGEGVGDATMDHLRAAYGHRAVWLGQSGSGKQAQASLEAGIDASRKSADSAFDRDTLAAELVGSTAFAYQQGSTLGVHISARGVVREVDTPILSKAIDADKLTASFIIGGVIRLEHGFIVFLVPSDRLPSRASLDEALERTLVIITAFDRFTQREVWEAHNFLLARNAVARDLHDTVLQTLASLRMRMSTLLSRADAYDQATMKRGLEEVQAIISDEQRTLRDVIEGAQHDAALDRDLNDVISKTASAVGAQWGVECAFTPLPSAITVDEHASNQCNQIIREVVSNAVRHGRASRFSVSASIDSDTLMIAVRDDSANRGADTRPDPEIPSKSVAQRLAYAGGSAYVDRAESGSIFAIRIPLTEGQHG